MRTVATGLVSPTSALQPPPVEFDLFTPSDKSEEYVKQAALRLLSKVR